MAALHDLIVIGAGSAGITAAQFAAKLGARVALVEKARIGGDCTWTGCIPSKALLKAAKIAHEVRTATQYGLLASNATVDFRIVRAYVRDIIQQIAERESPALLEQQGIQVVSGPAQFQDAHTLCVGDALLTGRRFLLATGAHPLLPDLPGLEGTPFCTYTTLFENDRLPDRLLVLGAGPIGMEMAQAYQRLGARVTLIGDVLLPKDEPEAQSVLHTVLRREGVQFVSGRATRAAYAREGFTLSVGDGEYSGDMLLLATGRVPNVQGLALEKAGVAYSAKGIPVNAYLQTNVKHIYAAGDCIGGDQYTHLAGWQAFQATRNALLVGRTKGTSDWVPRCTFTDPEVAHVGQTESEARARYGESVRVLTQEVTDNDRAICENDLDGLLKVVHLPDGRILGATIVAARAGEMITEFALALQHRLKIGNLASTLHAYPTYSSAIQILAAQETVRSTLLGPGGRLIRLLSGLSARRTPANSSQEQT